MAVSSIKGIRLIQGNPAMGAAFDVPEERVKEFLSAPCPAGAESLEQRLRFRASRMRQACPRQIVVESDQKRVGPSQVLDNAALPPLQDPPNLNQVWHLRCLLRAEIDISAMLLHPHSIVSDILLRSARY
eukprot:3765073-Rhodomonas_salina.3